MTQIPNLAMGLKSIYKKNGDYKKALEIYELYVSTRDSLSDENIRKQAREKEFAYNLQKKEDAYKIVVQQNQIQSLHLHKDQYMLLGLVGLLGIVLVLAYLYLRQNTLRSRQKSMQLEQKILFSQMNPHFIFNSLNSIQHFIMSRQNEKAELYLSNFSKLIRDMLESNTKESISVKEEARMLSSYMEMESLRFSRSFEHSLHVDERIDQEKVNIPHMMIQPFVENAIWHGLLAKDGDRLLRVTFEYDTTQTVRCTVEDNGVGREKSMKTEATFRKKSLALSFIRERIEFMRNTFKVDCSIKIIDKTDAAGESLGNKGYYHITNKY